MNVSPETAPRREIASWQPLHEARQGPRAPNLGPAARALSLVAGGAAILAGLRRRGPLGALFYLAGGLLVRRGYTGHCGLFRMLGASSAGHRTLVSAHESVTISRPREEVERAFQAERHELLGPLNPLVDTHFTEAPGGRGTEVALVASCGFDARGLELARDRLRGLGLSARLRDALRRFKARIEAGEVPTLAGQPAPAGRFLA